MLVRGDLVNVLKEFYNEDYGLYLIPFSSCDYDVSDAIISFMRRGYGLLAKYYSDETGHFYLSERDAEEDGVDFEPIYFLFDLNKQKVEGLDLSSYITLGENLGEYTSWDKYLGNQIVKIPLTDYFNNSHLCKEVDDTLLNYDSYENIGNRVSIIYLALNNEYFEYRVALGECDSKGNIASSIF